MPLDAKLNRLASTAPVLPAQTYPAFRSVAVDVSIA
jgi:hypothetical protein